MSTTKKPPNYSNIDYKIKCKIISYLNNPSKFIKDINNINN